jgi:hypothetical protein
MGTLIPFLNGLGKKAGTVRTVTEGNKPLLYRLKILSTHLTNDVFVGKSNDHSVLWSVVLILFLNHQAFSCKKICLALWKTNVMILLYISPQTYSMELSFSDLVNIQSLTSEQSSIH